MSAFGGAMGSGTVSNTSADKKYAAFISHQKSSAAVTARFLHDTIEMMVNTLIEPPPALGLYSPALGLITLW